jgi:hypothetical protein
VCFAFCPTINPFAVNVHVNTVLPSCVHLFRDHRRSRGYPRFSEMLSNCTCDGRALYDRSSSLQISMYCFANIWGGTQFGSAAHMSGETSRTFASLLKERLFECWYRCVRCTHLCVAGPGSSRRLLGHVQAHYGRLPFPIRYSKVIPSKDNIIFHC